MTASPELIAFLATHEGRCPVFGFEGLYEVSAEGEVFRLPRTTLGPHGETRQLEPKKMSTSDNGRGYRRVQLKGHDGKYHTRYVHRIVLESFVGPCPIGMECCHGDGDRANNLLTNLRWDTHSSNMYDAVGSRTHNKSSRTTCPRGHLLQGPNVLAGHARKGHRACRACELARKMHDWRGLSLDQLADVRYAEIMSGNPGRRRRTNRPTT